MLGRSWEYECQDTLLIIRCQAILQSKVRDITRTNTSVAQGSNSSLWLSGKLTITKVLALWQLLSSKETSFLSDKCHSLTRLLIELITFSHTCCNRATNCCFLLAKRRTPVCFRWNRSRLSRNPNWWRTCLRLRLFLQKHPQKIFAMNSVIICKKLSHKRSWMKNFNCKTEKMSQKNKQRKLRINRANHSGSDCADL